MQTTVSLSEVLNNIKLANNGYVFASSLSPEFLRRTEQLVKRHVVLRDTLVKSNGELEVAYFISRNAWICALETEPKMKTVTVDYEAKILNQTERYLAEC